MKDYVAENKRILEKWQKKFVAENQSKYPDCSNLHEYFACDGIMFKGDYKPTIREYENGKTVFSWKRNENRKENELWANAPLRILFLTKDQNSSGDIAWDVRSESYFCNDANFEPKETYNIEGSDFNRNLVYSLYGIINTTAGKPVEYFDEDFTDKKALHLVDEWPFARINVKKEVGGGSCEDSVLINAIENDGDLLKEQILNLDADILICCGRKKVIPKTGNYILNFIKDEVYKGLKPVPEDDDRKWIYYDESTNKIAINSYHPSYRKFEDYFDDMTKAYSEFLKLPTKFKTKLR